MPSIRWRAAVGRGARSHLPGTSRIVVFGVDGVSERITEEEAAACAGMNDWLVFPDPEEPSAPEKNGKNGKQVAKDEPAQKVDGSGAAVGGDDGCDGAVPDSPTVSNVDPEAVGEADAVQQDPTPAVPAEPDGAGEPEPVADAVDAPAAPVAQTEAKKTAPAS